MYPLTAWLALVGSVWALFALAEDHVSPQSRTQITDWLRCQTPSWPATFVAACDSVFGTPVVSVPCFLRACVASHIAAFLALCLSGVFYPGTSGVMLVMLLLYAPLLMGGLVLVNLLPGYISLLVNRCLLQRLSHSHRPGCLGVGLVLTSAATLTLALIACGLGFVVVFVSSQAHLLRRPVAWIVGYVEFVLKGTSGSMGALQEAVRLQPVVLPGIAFPSFGIWFYAPCFPLVWMWLYVLSGTLIRCATAWGLLHTPGRAGGLLDINARPLHTLGAVAAGLVSVVYWAAVFWRR
jgi:hypothetical protein